jgi:hypothetical protein
MGPELKARVAKPHGMAPLRDEHVRVQGENPICGDRLAFGALHETGRLTELRFQASACPACLAVASCAVELFEGGELPAGPPFDRLRGRIQELGGLATHEGHALKLVEQLLSELREQVSAE